jgi:7-cyano-7-deazaguanine synthase in queuosine biosynthesis
MSRNVIIWSGGADSTALLHHYAGVSCASYSVRAITVRYHTHINKDALYMQRLSQDAYLHWAKEKGYWINHEYVQIRGRFVIERPDDAPSAQMSMWLGAVMPLVSEGDRVMFAYIKNDCMWHYKQEFIDAFNAMCRVKGVKATVDFPFEWCSKFDILKKLRDANIPRSCWWSCEFVKGKRPCGRCGKCKEIKAAMAEIRKKKG